MAHRAKLPGQPENGWFTFTEIAINGIMVGWMQNRPHYCDRRRVRVNITLPDIDSADMFPAIT